MVTAKRTFFIKENTAGKAFTNRTEKQIA